MDILVFGAPESIMQLQQKDPTVFAHSVFSSGHGLGSASHSSKQGWAGKDFFEFPFPVFAFAGNTCCLSLPTRQQILLPATKNVADEFEIVLPEISGNLPFVAGKHIAGNHSSFCRKFDSVQRGSEIFRQL